MPSRNIKKINITTKLNSQRMVNGSGNYHVDVPWNHMLMSDWVLAAQHAGDDDWKCTKSRAWDIYPTEYIRFIYLQDELSAVWYFLATKSYVEGLGYKGRGMSKRAKLEFEEHFVEVENCEEDSYIYEVRAAGLQ
jgi:hypothetical protein